MVDYFSILEQPLRYALDKQALRTQFLRLQATYHPDRHMHEPKEQQNQWRQKSLLLNEAYRTLSDPYERATYFIKQHSTLGHAATIHQVDSAFLLWVLEQQETIESYTAESNRAALLTCAQEYQQRLSAYETNIENLFNAYDSATLHTAEITSQLVRIVNERRYLRNLLQEIHTQLAQLPA